MNYQVTDHVTGRAVQGGLTEEHAVMLCRGLNLDAGPGGRYGVDPDGAALACRAEGHKWLDPEGAEDTCQRCGKSVRRSS